MRRILVLPLVLLSVALGLAAPADASPTRVIPLPGARSVEPVAAGTGHQAGSRIGPVARAVQNAFKGEVEEEN